MADENNAQGNKQQIQIQVPEAVQIGVYSNAVSVNVNTNEVILDFGYIMPNTSPSTIKVVSRVNMNHRTAESFMRVLQNALLDFRNKQKESQTVKENNEEKL